MSDGKKMSYDDVVDLALGLGVHGAVETSELKKKLKEREDQLATLQADLDYLRYCTFAHSLHWFEKTYDCKREYIQSVQYTGGHGYITCVVEMDNGLRFPVTEDSYAGMLIDWAKAKGKYKEQGT